MKKVDFYELMSFEGHLVKFFPPKNTPSWQKMTNGDNSGFFGKIVVLVNVESEETSGFVEPDAWRHITILENGQLAKVLINTFVEYEVLNI